MKVKIPIVNFLVEKDTDFHTPCLAMSIMLLEKSGNSLTKLFATHFFTNPMSPSRFYPFVRLQSRAKEIPFSVAYNKILTAVFEMNFILTSSKCKILDTLNFYFHMFSPLKGKRAKIKEVMLKLSQQIVEVPVQGTNILHSLDSIKILTLQIKEAVEAKRVVFEVNRDGTVVAVIVDGSYHRLPSTNIIEYLPQSLEKDITLEVAPPISTISKEAEQEVREGDEKSREAGRREEQQETAGTDAVKEAERAKAEREVAEQEKQEQEGRHLENETESVLESLEEEIEEEVDYDVKNAVYQEDSTIDMDILMPEVRRGQEEQEKEDNERHKVLQEIKNRDRILKKSGLTSLEDEKEEKASYLKKEKLAMQQEEQGKEDPVQDFLTDSFAESGETRSGKEKTSVIERTGAYDDVVKGFLVSFFEVLSFYNDTEVIKYVKVKSPFEIDFFNFLAKNTANILPHKVLPYYSFVFKLREEKGFLPVKLSENYSVFAKNYFSLMEKTLETVGARNKLAVLVHVARRILDTYQEFESEAKWFVEEVSSYEKRLRRELSRINLILPKLLFVPQGNTISDVIDERLREVFPNSLLHGSEVFAVRLPADFTERIISRFSITEWEKAMQKTKNCLSAYVKAVETTAERGGFNADELGKFLEVFKEKAGSFLVSVLMPYDFVNR